MSRKYRLYHAIYKDGGFRYVMIDLAELEEAPVKDFFVRADEIEDLIDEGVYEIEGDDPGILDSYFDVGSSF